MLPQPSVQLSPRARETLILPIPLYVEMVPPLLVLSRPPATLLPLRQNLYQYAFNSPLRFVDATGLYEADFHYGLTKYLAIQAGFSESDAEVIARGTIRPDQDFRSPVGNQLKIWGGRFGLYSDQEVENARAVLRQWHFARDKNAEVVTPDSPATREKVRRAIESGKLNDFGEGLHPFEDSWAHQGRPYFGDSGHAKERGGGLSHKADQTFQFPDDAWQAARRTYDMMLDFLKQHPEYRNRPSRDFRELEKQLEQFINAKTKADKRKAFESMGVQMPDEFWKDISLPAGDGRASGRRGR